MRGPANMLSRDIHTGAIVDCWRCGDFSVSREAVTDFLPLKERKQRALASHLIRKLQGATRPALSSQFFESLSQRTLPVPAEVIDNLLLWFAARADGSPGTQIILDYPDQAIQALIGVIGDHDLQWAGAALTTEGLISFAPSTGGQLSSLTPKGWLRIDELKRANVAFQYAFFARKFENADLDILFERCLRRAVAQTGYELRTVTQRAGLVDAIIEDEIRRCRFLIADLSDDNPGAYWEAGFAEGLRKPVIYVCRATEGHEQKKTHFDTNHRHTVRWDLSSLEQTASDLKAVIRNSLLGDAKQGD